MAGPQPAVNSGTTSPGSADCERLCETIQCSDLDFKHQSLYSLWNCYGILLWLWNTAMEYSYGILLWLHIQYKHVQVLQKRRHEIQDKSASKVTGLKLPNWFYLWHPQMMLTENHHVESVNQRTEWLCWLCRITRSYSSQLQNFIALNVANNMAGCQVGQNQGLVHPISNIPGSSSTIGFSYNIIGYHGTTSFRLGNLRYTMDIYGHLWTSMGPFQAWFLDISGDPKSPKQSSSLWVKFSVSSRFSPSCATTSRPGMWSETRPKNPNLWGDLQDFQHGKLQETYSKKMTSPSTSTRPNRWTQIPVFNVQSIL